jgi:hypothetical protein
MFNIYTVLYTAFTRPVSPGSVQQIMSYRRQLTLQRQFRHLNGHTRDRHQVQFSCILCVEFRPAQYREYFDIHDFE